MKRSLPAASRLIRSRDYAECGVDFISVGALTHSVKGLDMSFLKAC